MIFSVLQNGLQVNEISIIFYFHVNVSLEDIYLNLNCVYYNRNKSNF